MRLSTLSRPLAFALLAMAGLLVATSTASATSIEFRATTTGCFTKTTCTPLASDTVDSLTFTGTTTDQTLLNVPLNTTLDPFSLGTFSVPTDGGRSTNVNFGSDNYFDLLVTFTLPTGAGDTTFAATLVGKITGGVNNSSVTIDFPQSAVPFTFSNLDGDGTFNLFVMNDPTFTYSGNGIAPGSVDVRGRIVLTSFTDANGGTGSVDVSAVPEPATLVMLGTGLLGLVKVRNRKRNNP